MAGDQLIIAGRGGGKSGGGGGQSNDANTIRSNARARLLEVISEGPIGGLVDGERSIYLDQTPLKNADNSYNYKEVIWSQHVGLADEGFFNGHLAVETPASVEVQVKKATGAVQRTIVDVNADAVRVIVRVPALVHQTDDGLKKTSLAYEIDVRAYNGTWSTVVSKVLANEKALSPFQISHRIDLPLNGSPWDVRIRRITDDSADDRLQNDLYWESYITLVEGKFILPHSAAIAMEVNAEEMGSSIPPRSYEVYGLLVQVPVNYNPTTRVYTGIWNGSFKTAWTNNPAWIFYDLLINDRYGLGEFINPAIVDKWSLYTIAQYCDQLVPSGYKNGDTGVAIMEPRFTYNGVINSRDEAYFVLQSVTQAWRGMAYWALGKVFATADMPADPVRLVSPANVIGGDLEYAGTALKARHSVVRVKWNDPDDFYRPATEVVIDSDLLNKYGWREKSVQLRGCTSRGLAHRYGKWIIDTEQHETDTLTYSASWDHVELRPGDIIAVSDPRKADIRAGGRIKSHVLKTIVLDAPFEATAGHSYSLMLTMPNGAIETRAIASFTNSTTVVVSATYPSLASPDAMWAITGTDITPRKYRVLAVDETEANIFKITALFHDPSKYARVEQGITFDESPYTRTSKASTPPSALTVAETGYITNGQTNLALTVSWTPPQNFLYRGFLVTADTPSNGRVTVGTTVASFIEMQGIENGIYTFYVQTISQAGVMSEAAEITYTASGADGFTLPTVSNFGLVENLESTDFNGPDIRVTWKNNFSQTLDGELTNDASPHYAFNTVKVYHGPTNTLLRTERVNSLSYTYPYLANRNDCVGAGVAAPSRQIRIDVTVSDIYGRTSVPVSKTFNNPVPSVVNPIITPKDNYFTMTWMPSTDADYAGYLVWVSETPGFNPNLTTPYYDGHSNAVTIPGDPTLTYYVRVAAYDAFGKTGLNVSGEMTTTLVATPLSVSLSDTQSDVIDLLTSMNRLADDIARRVEQVAHDAAAGTGQNIVDRKVLRKQLGSAVAQIITEAQLRADADGALASQITTLEASIEGTVATALTSLETRVDSVEGVNVAQASAITAVQAQGNQATAQGLLSFAVQSSPNAGSLVTINLMARAALTGTADQTAFKTSGLNIELYLDDGIVKSKVSILTDKFVVSDGTNSGTPLVFEGGVLKLQVAKIGDVIADRIRSTNGKLDIKGSGSLASIELFS